MLKNNSSRNTIIDMLYGYARVSIDAQENTLQIQALLKAGGRRKNIVQKVLSGTTNPQNHSKLSKLLVDLRNGDELIVWRLDRLGRMERALIVERVNAGIVAARLKGRKFGGPRKIREDTIRQIHTLRRAGDAVADIARTVDLARYETAIKILGMITAMRSAWIHKENLHCPTSPPGSTDLQEDINIEVLFLKDRGLDNLLF